MKFLTTAAFAICLPFAAHAQQSQPPAVAAKEPFTPGLGEIMTLQQMRHLKLWFAGQAGNWPLAGYELDELKEGFEDIVKYFPTKDGVPTGAMATAVIEKEVAEVNKAIEAKDRKQFGTAFDRLTASCNACHQASKHDFIVIRRPASNPYGNQSFAPVRNAPPHKH
ncbi:MAG: cytochrome c [Alphaproteobacteria bacterium]|nr:MAG: cytochrome c [Alphaproteobacteria bacterium]